MGSLSPPKIGIVLFLAGLQILLALWIDHRIERSVAHQLAERPPLRVLNVSDVVRDGSAAALGAALNARQREANRLAEQGVLVLDHGSGRVLAAPPALIVHIRPGLEARNAP